MRWKKIDSHPHYEVSDYGIVRKEDGTIIGQFLHKEYPTVRLSSPRKLITVHRLVAIAFLEPDKKRPFVNHIDCNKSNNFYKNLEWCTQAENVKHSRNLGRYPDNYWKGKRSPSACLTDDKVKEIKERYGQGNISWEKLGKEYGVSKRTIGRIVNGETYVQVQ